MTTAVQDPNKVAIYFDASRCMGCKGCQVACKQWNQLPSPMLDSDYHFTGSYESPLENDGDTWLHMSFNEQESGDPLKPIAWAFGRVSCQHCTDAGCVEACPTGACHHLDNGAVVIDQDRCIGCQFCVVSCPYHVPKMLERTNTSRKCWLCMNRVERGREPSCTQTCPAEAMEFGPRSEMIELAHHRLAEIKDRYPNAVVYGENELGGLHVIQVLQYGAEAHGMPVDPKINLMHKIAMLSKPIAGLGTAAILGFVAVSYFLNRDYHRGVNELYYDPETKKTYSKETGELWFTSDRNEAKEENEPLTYEGQKELVEEHDEKKEGEEQ